MLYITGFYGVTEFKSIKDFSYKSGITIKIDRVTLVELDIPETVIFADKCKEIHTRLLCTDKNTELKTVFQYGSTGIVIFNETYD